MTFEQKIQLMNTKTFDLISTKEITFLKDLDNRITINKNGKFCYYKFLELNSNSIWNFLLDLDLNTVYSVIPFITANNKPDEPYIILSQSILISGKSDPILISKYINDKIRLACDTYYLDDTVLEMIECSDNYSDKPGVIIKYNEITIF